MNKFCLPENISAEIFVRDYWQKKPLLIRNGLPQIVGLLEPQDLIDLAQNEDATARLVKKFSEDDWQLHLSPLDESHFADLPKHWSVLVQNLEQWSTELGDLWRQFGFIPQWQRDDIMISYAPEGGSVGKHYDEYDVFLVQAYGHRRWQLGKWCEPSTEFKANQPIRIFDDMGELIFDEVMQPGDILYVPSRLSHYGVAQDDCLTVSFGLRYPNAAELLENLSKNLCNPQLDLAELSIPMRLTLSPQSTGELAEDSIQQMKQQFLQLLNHSAQFDQLFRAAVANSASSRRYEILQTEEYADPDEVLEMLQEDGFLLQDNNCKLVYLASPLQIYANGELLDELNAVEAQILRQLADGESVTLSQIEALLAQSDESELSLELIIDSICNWLDDGWVLLEQAD